MVTGRVRVSSAQLRLCPVFDPIKALGFSVEWWFTLEKRPFQKTSLSNAIYGNSSEFSDDVISPPPVNGAQDLHGNIPHWRRSIPGLSNQNEPKLQRLQFVSLAC